MAILPRDGYGVATLTGLPKFVRPARSYEGTYNPVLVNPSAEFQFQTQVLTFYTSINVSGGKSCFCQLSRWC
ncbi:hypothetical protein Plhal304r1_c020g0071771 [Plasmopara halstedii]